MPRLSIGASDVGRIIFFAHPNRVWPVAFELTAEDGVFNRQAPGSGHLEPVDGQLIDDLLAAVCGPAEGEGERPFAYAADLLRFEFRIVLRDGGQIIVSSSPETLSLTPWRITKQDDTWYDSINPDIRVMTARLLPEKLAVLSQFRARNQAGKQEGSRDDANAEPMDEALVELRAVREVLRGEMSEELRAEISHHHAFTEDLSRACIRAHDQFAKLGAARLSELTGQTVEVERLGQLEGEFYYDTMASLPPTDNAAATSGPLLIAFSLCSPGCRTITFVSFIGLEELDGALPERAASATPAADSQAQMSPAVLVLLAALGDAIPAQLGGVKREKRRLRDFAKLDDQISTLMFEVRAPGTKGALKLWYFSDSATTHMCNFFVPEVVKARFLVRKLPEFHGEVAAQAEKLIPKEPDTLREFRDPLAAELATSREDDPVVPRPWAVLRDVLETRDHPVLWAVRFDPGGPALLSLSKQTMERLDVHSEEDGDYRLTPAETARLEAIVRVLVGELDEGWGSLMTVADETLEIVDGLNADFGDDRIISIHCDNGVTVHYSQPDLEEAVLAQLAEPGR